MAPTVAPPVDQTAELMQKLSIDSQSKPLDIPEPTKKPSVYQYGSVDSGNVGNTQVPSFERSATPLLPDFMDPTMCYIPSGYPSAYYYGGFDGSGNEWDEYSQYVNPDGVDMTNGVYADNGSLMYHHGYGYAPYGPYSPATSPVPTLGSDGQLYGPQHYQYPPFFQPMTLTNGPFSSNPAAPPHGEFVTSATTDQKPLPIETVNLNSNGVPNGGNVKGGNGADAIKPSYPNSFNSNNIYGRGAPTGGVPTSAYHDPRYGFDGFQSSIPWHDGSMYSDGQHRPVTSTGINYSVSKANGFPSSRNQNFQLNSNYMGLQHPEPMSGMGTAHGYISRMYPNKPYNQYGNTFRSGMGFGSNGYDLRTNGRGWLADKYRPRGRGNGYFGAGNDIMDSFNELNRGPRAKGLKNQKCETPVTEATNGQNIPSDGTKDEEKERACVVPDREQYNREEFPVDYDDAKFFVIKSYSEDDVHKSIKYSVWASTPNGNKKLDAAYHEAQQKSGHCPIFLFFSVNTSGQFVGLAEMVGPVDFQKNVEFWQQDKWTGCFPVKWHIVKDVPNNSLKHITLENNENKPVTNSRDTQEIKIEQGLKLLKIFKENSSKTCILDDFEFYEVRQKAIQEKKAKHQLQKQVWEGKPSADEKAEVATKTNSESTNEPSLAANPNCSLPPSGDAQSKGC
ncbi:evolutionarily conserved C-terminal region 2 [Hibiscus trionum]|uniref:YTH domain-containing family protein n=1 Tax=Hibiscus trionum TaxID=183268 RepID=A0A9W7HB42_HIBTR|nr:evolutionarily conserved C-terminal region 2 [Hibiscus trionum]